MPPATDGWRFSHEPEAPGGGTAGKTEPLPFDTGVAPPARVYDCLLGGYFL